MTGRTLEKFLFYLGYDIATSLAPTVVLDVFLVPWLAYHHAIDDDEALRRRFEIAVLAVGASSSLIVIAAAVWRIAQ